MSNETIEEREQELKELEKQIDKVVEAEKEQAAQLPSPEILASDEPASDPNPEPSEPSVIQEKSEVKTKDDPMEWAKAKGFKSPEDMARALLQKEREFHDSRQKQSQNQPQTREWQPRPEVGYPREEYQPSYPQYPQRGNSFNELAALYPQVDPEDLRRFMPIVVDAAQAIARRERMELETKITGIQKESERNKELMTLLQDPAFRDNRVQKEIHSVLDADPTIFQRERTPLVKAYEIAMVNLARKQLQQGVISEPSSPGNMPPVTAGGGSGSSNTAPKRITQREFDSWEIKDQEKYLNSNGRIVPKR